MSRKLTGFLFLLQLLSGCSHYEYWDISKFNIDDTALKDEDMITLLYSSREPNYNWKTDDYFIHLIAVSQTTGDTVNILTTVYAPASGGDNSKTFIFCSQNRWVNKLIQMGPDKMGTIKKIEDIPKVSTKKITKVARNPDYDELADNHYPTVIGTIARKM